MLYCEECRTLTDNKCPFCGTKKLREPRPSDYCYFTSDNTFGLDALVEVFKDNGIVVTTETQFSPGDFKRGEMQELLSLYVQYDQISTAVDLTNQFFSNEAAVDYDDGECEDDLTPFKPKLSAAIESMYEYKTEEPKKSFLSKLGKVLR